MIDWETDEGKKVKEERRHASVFNYSRILILSKLRR